MATPPDQAQEQARTALIERLRALGQSDAAIAAAEREDRLATFAVEIALGGDRKHTLTGVSRLSGLSPEFLRKLMQASGRWVAARRSSCRRSRAR